MSKTLLLHEVKHEQFIVTDFNDYGEEIETTLPENVRVFSEISENDIQEGMRNVYALSM